jgi:hypothetical protein
MSEQIRDVATVTFSGSRFEGPGIEPAVFSFLIRYQELLVETAKAWGGKQLPVRMRFYPVENPRGVVIRKIVTVVEGCAFSATGVPDAIDEAAKLIDATLISIRKRTGPAYGMPKQVVPMVAALGDSVEQGETITVQSAWSKEPGVLTWGMRLKLQRYKIVEPDEPRAADDPPLGTMIRDPQRALKRRSMPPHVYDESVPPLWQTVVALGASLSDDEWKDVPPDLAQNLDHYLYGTSSET